MKHDSLKQYVTLHNSLTAEKAKLESRLNAINQALGGSPKAPASKRPKVKMSASARARIGAAQKARWAKLRAAKNRA